jgi:hypothetical protein
VAGTASGILVLKVPQSITSPLLDLQTLLLLLLGRCHMTLDLLDEIINVDLTVD